MTTFEEIPEKKKFALHNSYFKNLRRGIDPATPYEVMEYVKQHGELPYRAELTKNWLYDCYIEYQKREGVTDSQFFTPPETAKRMVELAQDYSVIGENALILDACCSFGMLTKRISEIFPNNDVHAFDIDKELCYLCNFICGQKSEEHDYRDGKFYGYDFELIISNPPYEIKDLTAFFEFLHASLRSEKSIAVLLLPKGFIDKTSPKRTAEILSYFNVLHREDMTEPFARTKTRAEIVVLKKL